MIRIRTLLGYAALTASPFCSLVPPVAAGDEPRRAPHVQAFVDDLRARVDADLGRPVLDPIDAEEGDEEFDVMPTSTMQFTNARARLAVTGQGGLYRVQGSFRHDDGRTIPVLMEGTPEELGPKLKALPPALRALVLWQFEADVEVDAAAEVDGEVDADLDAKLEADEGDPAPGARVTARALSDPADPVEALAIASTNGRHTIEGMYRDAGGECRKFKCEGNDSQIKAQLERLPALVRDRVNRQMNGR